MSTVPPWGRHTPVRPMRTFHMQIPFTPGYRWRCRTTTMHQNRLPYQSSFYYITYCTECPDFVTLNSVIDMILNFVSLFNVFNYVSSTWSFVIFIHKDGSLPPDYTRPPPLHQTTSTRLHGATTQKTAIFVLTAVRTSIPTYIYSQFTCTLKSCIFLSDDVVSYWNRTWAKLAVF
jgi:hypothetical protein